MGELGKTVAVLAVLAAAAAASHSSAPRHAATPAGRAVLTDVHARHAGGPITGGTLGCTGLERLWERAGGNPAEAFMAAEIAMAESSGNQYATDHNTNGSTDRGYWQINDSHGSLSTYDAYGNARAAVIISQGGTDWYPWVTYQRGAYQGRC